MRKTTIVLFALGSMLFSGSAFAADLTGEPGRSAEGKNSLNNVYFGEQHLHTSASPDAFAFGTRNDANDGYRYAKGLSMKFKKMSFNKPETITQ